MGIVEEYFDEETADEELVLKDKDIKELIYEEAVEEKLLVELLNQFLYSLPTEKRNIFLSVTLIKTVIRLCVS